MYMSANNFLLFTNEILLRLLSHIICIYIIHFLQLLILIKTLTSIPSSSILGMAMNHKYFISIISYTELFGLYHILWLVLVLFTRNNLLKYSPCYLTFFMTYLSCENTSNGNTNLWFNFNCYARFDK